MQTDEKSSDGQDKYVPGMPGLLRVTGSKFATGLRADLNSQLAGFNKQGLKKTETQIITTSGSRLKETRDADGNFNQEVTKQGTFEDTTPCVKVDTNVGQVRDNLYISSIDVPKDLNILEKLGITHILNLSNFVHSHLPDSIQCSKINIQDVINADALQHFDTAFEFIDDGRKHGAVLVHCTAGVSRSATFVIGYLMNRERILLDDAYKQVKDKRDRVCPNEGFWEQLQKYEQQLGLKA